MKKTRLISVFLLISLLLSLLILPSNAAEPETTGAETQPETQAETEAPWADDPTGYRENLLAGAPDYEAGCDTALLLELNSGIVVYAKNAEAMVYPASLTKIMTCMVALEYAGKDLDKMVTVSESALAGIAEAGGEVRLQAGERLTLRDLLYYLMVNSTNEAGNVIAEYVAGDIPSFVTLMNKTARELGCTGTRFANTHGLHDSGHYTTARDLSIITRKALTYEMFREICDTAEYTVPATNLSNERKLITTNNLILNDGNRYLADNGNYYPYYLEEASGIKTGYTSAAGRCVISRATDGNMDLLCIIMGAQTRMMSDGSARYDNFVEAKKLFNYGFSNFAYAKVAAAGIEPMFQVNVQYARDKRGVVLIPSSDVNCLLPKEYDRDRVTTHYELDDPKGLVAPLEQGQRVGTLYLSYDGTVVGSTALETLTAVEEKSVDKAIADLTGKDKPEEEKSLIQKLFGYWYVPILLIVGLLLILLIRNAVYRHSRRKALERRRRRAMIRDAKAADTQRRAGGRSQQFDMSQQTRRVYPVNRDGSDRGGRS
ncbi:MAG: D-alanyl-D-alanine carboxypeptidase [Oscillospiraceae bacterium]|nr:D-alanyl-D-alanine carboxypeptidase [Oscillospiraceae bacterium]